MNVFQSVFERTSVLVKSCVNPCVSIIARNLSTLSLVCFWLFNTINTFFPVEFYEMDSVLKYYLSHMTSREVSRKFSSQNNIHISLNLASALSLINNVNYDHKLTGSKLITDQKQYYVLICLCFTRDCNQISKTKQSLNGFHVL